MKEREPHLVSTKALPFLEAPLTLEKLIELKNLGLIRLEIQEYGKTRCFLPETVHRVNSEFAKLTILMVTVSKASVAKRDEALWRRIKKVLKQNGFQRNSNRKWDCQMEYGYWGICPLKAKKKPPRRHYISWADDCCPDSPGFPERRPDARGRKLGFFHPDPEINRAILDLLIKIEEYSIRHKGKNQSGTSWLIWASRIPKTKTILSEDGVIFPMTVDMALKFISGRWKNFPEKKK